MTIKSYSDNIINNRHYRDLLRTPKRLHSNSESTPTLKLISPTREPPVWITSFRCAKSLHKFKNDFFALLHPHPKSFIFQGLDPNSLFGKVPLVLQRGVGSLSLLHSGPGVGATFVLHISRLPAEPGIRRAWENLRWFYYYLPRSLCKLCLSFFITDNGFSVLGVAIWVVNRDYITLSKLISIYMVSWSNFNLRDAAYVGIISVRSDNTSPFPGWINFTRCNAVPVCIEATPEWKFWMVFDYFGLANDSCCSKSMVLKLTKFFVQLRPNLNFFKFLMWLECFYFFVDLLVFILPAEICPRIMSDSKGAFNWAKTYISSWFRTWASKE